MFNNVSDALLRAFVGLQIAARKEDGQNSLEYIVAVVFIVIAAAAGFKIAGGDIKNTASQFINKVLNP